MLTGPNDMPRCIAGDSLQRAGCTVGWQLCAHAPFMVTVCAQVCDFNLARALKTDMVEPSATLNSPAWSAPERLQGKRYGKSADVFSFGVILWELITLGMHTMGFHCCAVRAAVYCSPCLCAVSA